MQRSCSETLNKILHMFFQLRRPKTQWQNRVIQTGSSVSFLWIFLQGILESVGGFCFLGLDDCYDWGFVSWWNYNNAPCFFLKKSTSFVRLILQTEEYITSFGLMSWGFALWEKWFCCNEECSMWQMWLAGQKHLFQRMWKIYNICVQAYFLLLFFYITLSQLPSGARHKALGAKL